MLLIYYKQNKEVNLTKIYITTNTSILFNNFIKYKYKYKG